MPDTIDVRIDRNRRFTLADMAASTGAAPQLYLTNGGGFGRAAGDALRRASTFFPAFRRLGADDRIAELSAEMPHADGGGLDNLGLMPLLVRGVTNAFVFINTSTHDAEDNPDLRALFFPIGPASTTGDKTHNTVFAAAHWSRVTQQFTAARDAGQPQVFCDSGWQVAENPFYGIRAYDGLSICFFYNAQVRDWESALQPDVFCLLKGVKDGPCRDMTNDTRRDLLLRGNPDNFPWFATFFQNKPHFIKLTVPQVNLLANLSSWTLTREETRTLVLRHMPDLGGR
jgi:hypothetical protein